MAYTQIEPIGFGLSPFGDPSDSDLEKEYGRGFGDPSTPYTNEGGNTVNYLQREPGGMGRMPFGGKSDNEIIKEYGRKGFGDKQTPYTDEN